MESIFNVKLLNFMKHHMHAVTRVGKRALLSTTDPSVWNMSRKLRSLKNVYEGNRCFIMGNGPSLNKMDLSLFGREYVWASNKAYLLFDRIQWRPSFYVAVDTRVVPDIAKKIEQQVYPISNILCFFPVEFRENRVLQSGQNVYWYYVKHIKNMDDPFRVFTLNAQKWISSVTTVTIASLQLAVHLGFNPIYLIGCDTDYSVPNTVKYEGGNDYIVSTQNDDPNHFDSHYFGKDSRWHQPKPEKMILHYAKAKEVCDSVGVSVFNATVGGKLEIFPRVNYEDLF